MYYLDEPIKKITIIRIICKQHQHKHEFHILVFYLQINIPYFSICCEFFCFRVPPETRTTTNKICKVLVPSFQDLHPIFTLTVSFCRSYSFISLKREGFMQIGLTHVNKFVRYPATKRNRETVIPTIQNTDLPSTHRRATTTETCHQHFPTTNSFSLL